MTRRLSSYNHLMPDEVRITEVAPRDGLQNEPAIIPAAEKTRLVQLCAAAGVDEVEVTSFVSPKWVPQLGDAAQVFDLLIASTPAPARSPVIFSALVPNSTGLDAAIAVNHRARFQLLQKVSVFTAASETFSRKNTNATIAETIERFKPVIERAHASYLLVRGYISCAIACPFEGPIRPEAVAAVAHRLREIGVDEIDLGDTIGAGTPPTVLAMLLAVSDRLGSKNLPLTLHLHDTFGTATDCVKAALEIGIRSFDGSVAGLGGCPYASTPAKRAPGNISTESLVRTIHAAGFRTRADPAKLAVAAAFARSIVSAESGRVCADPSLPADEGAA